MKGTTHDRYVEMVSMLCAGETQKEIAAKFKTRSRVISASIVRLQKAYSARTTDQLIAILFRHGLLK
ncbi:MAG TPA: hypothetical protein VGN00_14125 [Puia sp.]|jgi:DNA-binding NarL/FixJ family response regulator